MCVASFLARTSASGDSPFHEAPAPNFGAKNLTEQTTLERRQSEWRDGVLSGLRVGRLCILIGQRCLDFNYCS